MTHAGSAVIHTPDKSGFPFGSRGVAAARSTSPPAVRGAFGVGYLNHCAPSEPDAHVTAILTRTAITRMRLSGQLEASLFIWSLCDETGAHRISADAMPHIDKRDSWNSSAP